MISQRIGGFITIKKYPEFPPYFPAQTVVSLNITSGDHLGAGIITLESGTIEEASELPVVFNLFNWSWGDAIDQPTLLTLVGSANFQISLINVFEDGRIFGATTSGAYKGGDFLAAASMFPHFLWSE